MEIENAFKGYYFIKFDHESQNYKNRHILEHNRKGLKKRKKSTLIIRPQVAQLTKTVAHVQISVTNMIIHTHKKFR